MASSSGRAKPSTRAIWRALAVAHQGHQGGGVLGGGQFDHHPGVRGTEPADQVGQGFGGQRGQGAQGQRPRLQPGHPEATADLAVSMSRSAWAVPDQGFAGRGEAYPPAQPVDELDAELFLQLFHA